MAMAYHPSLRSPFPTIAATGAPAANSGVEAVEMPSTTTPPVKRNLYVRSLPQEARRGNLAAVKQLVEEQGARLDEEVVGETALHFACFYGHLPVVAFLLSRPECRLNKRNLGGNTPLMRAVENGHTAVVALLLETAKQRQRPIAKRRNMKGETALHKAAVTGNVEVARLLVEEGGGCVEISARTHPDHGGDSPLHVAAERGHWDMVRYLLSIRDSSAAADEPAEPTIQPPVPASEPLAASTSTVSATRTSHGMTSASSVTPKVQRRANVAQLDLRNTKGRTPAHMPIVSGKRDMDESERLVGLRLLAEAGADLNARDSSGRTPLHWAVFANYVRLVAYLLSLGKARVDASIVDVCEYTAAHIAVNREHEQMAQVLDLYHADEPWEHALARLVQRAESDERVAVHGTEETAAAGGPKRRRKSVRRDPDTEEVVSGEQEGCLPAVADSAVKRRRTSTRSSARRQPADNGA